MRELISPECMLACERSWFGRGKDTSIACMERAARAVADVLLREYPSAKEVCVACGPGGNGGDGYACARLLRRAGLRVTLLPCGEAKSADAITNADRAREMAIPFSSLNDISASPDVWIDALYGTGLSRAPEGTAATLIERMNADEAPVIAVDIPSGLNGKTGRAFYPAARADITVALQYEKTGYYLQDGFDCCGRVIRANIGFPEEAFPRDLPRLIEPQDPAHYFPPRPRNIHKGSCGHLLIIAGSFGMAGAAALCARAALRSGVGLVSIACAKSIVPILQTLAPCAMCIPLAEDNGAIAKSAADTVHEILPGKSAVVIGCGLSRRADPAVLRAALESDLPTVIDADALNILSVHDDLKALLTRHHILTPHPGEAARLLGRPCDDPVADAEALFALGATVVLKGTGRVIRGVDRTFISGSGSGAMARGGSGDIFSGILGALLAEGSCRNYAETAAAACEIHGLCGECACRKYGSRAANAADLIEFLPEVLQRYVP